ncbi:MAG: metallophosphoesterase [Ignavibacteria bacterium]|nr:metallophosphoesterase [Ignavibacteria bacterium]
MNYKNILKYIFLYLTVFSSAGLNFTLPESNRNSLSFYQNNLQHRVIDESDSSEFSSDGPVIVYEEGNIKSYSVIPGSNDFKTSVKTIGAEDILSCYVDEKGDQFNFRLKESVNTENDVYDLPEKMLILSDIEGNFKGFYLILKGAGVINENFEWTFGNGHLVLVGDFFDRGLNVTECLWLIYKLEYEAEQSGGKVHFILGNHEMMVLRGDLRYVRAKYFSNADSLKLSYDKWFAKNTELGKWLRSKNAVEKIGDYLFVHAGISKDFPADTFSLTDINVNIRLSIDKTFPGGKTSKDIFIGSGGPLWYRGIIKETETQEDVEKTLSVFNSSKMIAGHTIVDSIKHLYNGKVIAIDLDHNENTKKGVMFALWFENGKFYMIDNNGLKSEL